MITNKLKTTDSELESELLEHEAKDLLRRYGLSVPRGKLATDPKQAATFAYKMGKPLAMKVIAHGLVHKSAAGFVRLNVAPSSVSAIFDELMRDAKRKLDVEGILVEEMAAPGVEVVIGVSSSPSFGPSIMFGAGGVDVEHRGDISFRLAPLTPGDARDMVHATSIAACCNARPGLGEEAINAIVHAMMKIGGKDGLIFAEAIQDLDINPLVVNAQGVLAVDAYARIAPATKFDWGKIGVIDASQRAKLQKDIYSSLRSLFSPKSIVVVGASSRPGKMGFEIIKCLVDYGYRGPIFGVNPSVNSIYGCPTFPRVADLPQSVERAIIAVAAAEVPSALAECASIGVRVAHVYSAGFSEWSNEGRDFERAIKDVVANTGIRVVGPNSNGAFCASGRLTKSPVRYSPDKPGTITFISQSGTYTSDVITRSKVMGIPLGKSLSCGNCLDLGPIDYLLYCAEDPETEIIAMYLETIENAGRFFRLAKEIDKPLVIIKGGRTVGGDRVATTHTGALATNHLLWSAAAKQAGAVFVESIPDLMDVLLGFSAFGTISGPGLALFTSGGGISVTATDVATDYGLQVPTLSTGVKRRLEHHIAPGTSITNPIDVPVWGLRTESGYIFHKMIETLGEDPQIHSVIATAEVGSIFNYARDEADGLNQLREIVKSVILVRAQSTRVSLVLRSTGEKHQDDFIRDIRPTLMEKHIAVYDNVIRAVKAHGKLVELGLRQHGTANE